MQAVSCLQWIPWIYVAWQLVRNNALVVMLVSLPLHWFLKRGKTVVILGSDRDYDRKREELMELIKGKTQLYGIPILRFHEQWAKVQYKKHFYIVHQNALCAYMAVRQELEEGNIVFATSRMDITDNVVVAKKISYDEGIEHIFLRKGHCGRAPPCTVLSCLETEGVNSKLWAILSLLPLYPLMLGYTGLSVVLSLLFMGLDMNKSWLHRFYLAASGAAIKWIKLCLFQHYSYLYTIFGMFSKRWNFCDPNAKMAYYLKPGETLLIKDYCKFTGSDDLHFFDKDLVYAQQQVGNKYDGCFQIDVDTAHYVWRLYNHRYLRLMCNKKLFVP